MKLVIRKRGFRSGEAADQGAPLVPAPAISLPTCRTAPAAHELLVEEATGAPVWPIRTDAEATALEQLCGVFGAAPRDVSARAGELPRDRGTVVGVGDVAQEARLYAHLTGRAWRVVEHADELRGEALPDVVLSLSPRLDARIVELLATAPFGERTSGLVWGRNRPELRTQVLLRSAAATLVAPPSWLFTGVVGYMTFDRLVHEDVEWLGAAAGAEALSEAVERGAALLALLVHGDPLSFRLADDVVVCGVPFEDDADPARAPLCRAIGACHKLDIPYARLPGSPERFVDPDALAARVLALVCCQGVALGSPALDAAWGVLPRLLANPRLGAVLATPDLSTFALGAIAEQLCKPLTAGVPVGRALAAYEQQPAVRKIGHRLLLFGDPATCVGPARLPPPLTPGDDAPAPPDRAAPPLDTADAELELLEAIAHYVRADTYAEGCATSPHAVDALERHRHERSAASAQALRLALLDHVATIRARPEDAWMLTLCELDRPRDHEPCPSCDWPVRPARARLTSGLVRTLVHCPRCANVVDRPHEATLALRAELPRLALDGPLPSRDWAGAVYLVSEDPRITEMLPWPGDSSGAPLPTVELSPPSGPSRPLAVRVVLIAGTTVHAFGVPGRIEARAAAAA